MKIKSKLITSLVALQMAVSSVAATLSYSDSHVGWGRDQRIADREKRKGLTGKAKRQQRRLDRVERKIAKRKEKGRKVPQRLEKRRNNLKQKLGQE